MVTDKTSLIDISVINAVYIEKLKGLTNKGCVTYPSLVSMNIDDNHFCYGSGSINLGLLRLDMVDERLFMLSADEIFFTINCFANSKNRHEYIDKYVSILDNILNKDYLNEEDINYIYNYVDDYYKRYLIISRFDNKYMVNEVNKMAVPLNKCYDSIHNGDIYYKPGTEYVRSLTTRYNEDALKHGPTNDKGYVKVRNMHKDIRNTSKIDSVAGFMSASLIISLVVSIAIVISIILYATI